jgi:hypothetical protein
MSLPRSETQGTMTAAQVNRRLAKQCEDAIALLDQLLKILPHLRFQEVGMAERAIVQLRDSLIEQLRQEKTSAEVSRLRALLERVNVAVSLVVGVEYPAVGIQQQPLEMARDVLKGVLVAGSR